MKKNQVEKAHHNSKPPQKQKKRSWRFQAFCGMLVLCIVGFILWVQLTPVAAPGAPAVTKKVAKSSPSRYPIPVGDPQQLTVASVDIDVPMTSVKLPADGVLVPPFDYAAWYADGPKPGAAGPSVIVGHVDSTKGPNVFWNLHKVKIGDQVVVQYPNKKITFVVTDTQTSPQDELPTSQIWNNTTDQVLRLVTCIGTFDYSTRHYSDNYIVYAKEVSI